MSKLRVGSFWKEEYKSKLVSPDIVAKVIQPNQIVQVGNFAGTPVSTTKALADAVKEGRLKGPITLVQATVFGELPFLERGMEKSIRNVAGYTGNPLQRKAIEEGRASYSPTTMYQSGVWLKRGVTSVDVALIQVSPPDKHGFCSFGISVDFTKVAAEMAKTVIAEVNERMPRTLGDSFIHVSDIDYVVEYNHPLFTLPEPAITKDVEKVAENVATLIDDESTLQVGIGDIPDALLNKLAGTKKDLGLHTEMISDNAVCLMQEGVINNKKKTLCQGKAVATFAGAYKHDMYDWMNDNPLLEFHTVDFVNNPFIIAQNRKMIAINSAIAVDIYGNISSESIGHRHYTGTGGQLDFAIGAHEAPEGKFIIAMTSTTHNGISKIVPEFPPGTTVTVQRVYADYVVTEYGIASLKGKTLRERAEALISIAHPKFQSELWEVVRKLKLS